MTRQFRAVDTSAIIPSVEVLRQISAEADTAGATTRLVVAITGEETCERTQTEAFGLGCRPSYVGWGGYDDLEDAVLRKLGLLDE